VIEYLGKDYPFYYTTLNEASEKLADIALIKKTADYLKQFPGRREVTGEYFINAFLNSGIIKNLL
jgi:hypothetical protein